MVAVVMTDERDKRNISNFITYAVKRHSHRRKSASFKLKPVCLPRSRCFIAPWSWSLSWWRIGHTKQKQMFAPYYHPILLSLYSVLYFLFFKDRLQFQRWRGKQFCISKALMMFTKNLFCFYKLTQSCCYDLLVFGDALKLQMATSHFTVTLQ